MSKPSEPIIKPTTDLFIAALWSNPKNEAILLSLLNSVLIDIGMPKIVSATVLNPINIQEFAGDKQIRLDVRVKDEKETQYIVEVQTADHAGFVERMLFYWSETHSAQLKRGEPYTRLRPTRSIILTEFPFRSGELKALHAVFDIRERSQPSVRLTDHFEMHVLRLGDLPKDTLQDLDGQGLGGQSLDRQSLGGLCPPLQDWIQFWHFGLEMKENNMSVSFHEPAVNAAFEEFKRFAGDPAMREWIRARERFLEEQNLILTASMDESEARGMTRGMALGEARGEARGETRGRAFGLAEGETKRSGEIARIMKAEGLPSALIARMTGLSLEEIKRLR